MTNGVPSHLIGVALIVLTASLALGVFVGCSTSSEGEQEEKEKHGYVGSVNEVTREAWSGRKVLASEMRHPFRGSEVLFALAHMGNSLTDAKAELREVQPPDKVKLEHERLIEIIRMGHVQVRRMVGRMRSGNRAAIEAAIPGFRRTLSALDRESKKVIREIEDALGAN